MTTWYTFILTLFQDGHKARTSTFMHLLKGKRTSSILLYGFFQGQLAKFALLPQLNTREFEGAVAVLLTEGFLVPVAEEEGVVQLSGEGRAYLAAQEIVPALPALNSFLYARHDEDFFELLLFTTQIISQMAHGERQYLPLDNRPLRQKLLKDWLLRQGQNRQELSVAFYQEWHQVFSALPPTQQSALSLMLSGYQRVGLTFQQVCQQFGWDTFSAWLGKKNALHQGLTLIRTQPTRFPLLTSLFDLLPLPLTTESGGVSASLFLAGASVTEISQQRRIKESTVNDHLIELALTTADFPFERIVTAELGLACEAYAQEHQAIRSWRFGPLKEAIPDLSFLAFRLYQIQQIRREEGCSL